MRPEQRLALLIAAGVALGLLAAAMAPRPPASAAIEWLPTPRPVGNLELEDGGSVWRPTGLGDDWSVVAFGFTHCPDVCPTSLAELARLARLMGDAAPRVTFVSVDPARDTAASATRYVRAFHPAFLAATGSAESLTRFTSAFGVQFEAAGDVVAHSTLFAVVDPGGRFVARFRPGFDVEAVARELGQARAQGRARR